MNDAGELGALYSLAHQKANELSALKAISEEVVFRLEQGMEEDAQLDAVAPLLQERDKGMARVDQLDKRMAFLTASGYEPEAAEAGRLALEQGTIRALLLSIQALSERGVRMLSQARDSLAESMKDVRDIQKSLQAYTSQEDEEEPRQVDTLR